LLVHDSVRAEVVAELTEELAAVRRGDPLDPSSQIGPLASRAQYGRVTGAWLRLRTTTAPLVPVPPALAAICQEQGGGLFVEPTLFDASDPRSRLRCEEIFGPVGALIGFESDEDPLRIANESELG
jgi:aldehyde dehydrogenase (NAD+)